MTVLPQPGQVSKQPPQALIKCPVMMSASIGLQLTWDLPHSKQLLAERPKKRKKKGEYTVTGFLIYSLCFSLLLTPFLTFYYSQIITTKTQIWINYYLISLLFSLHLPLIPPPLLLLLAGCQQVKKWLGTSEGETITHGAGCIDIRSSVLLCDLRAMCF